MILDKTILTMAAYGVTQYYKSGQYAELFDSKELADIVVQHSAAAGISAMAAGVLPGLGALVATGIAVGAIWTMYIRLCVYLHLKWKKELLKALASAVLANIIAQLGGILVLEFGLSFIPGMAIIANGIVNFGITYIAGIIFLKTLSYIFSVGGNPNSMTEDDLKESLSSVASDLDMKKVFSEAKNHFKRMREDGTLEKEGKKVDIES